MVIRVNHKKTIAKAVEWADKKRKKPIGFMLKCPYCHKSQWVHKKQLYIGYNGTKNNHRCKHCRIGLARIRKFGDPTYLAPQDGFFPRSPGWRSIYYDRPHQD
jgi:hypothetical protein